MPKCASMNSAKDRDYHLLKAYPRYKWLNISALTCHRAGAVLLMGGGPLLNLFAQRLGANNFQIAYLSSGSYMGLAIALLCTAVIHRSYKKRLLMMTWILGALLCLIFCFPWFYTHHDKNIVVVSLMVVITIIALANGAGQATWLSWSHMHLPLSKVNDFNAFRQMFGNLAYLSVVLVTATIFLKTRTLFMYRMFFSAAAFFFSLRVIFLAFVDCPETAQRNEDEYYPLRKCLKGFLADKKALKYFLSLFVIHFLIGAQLPFYLIYMRKVLGLSESFINYSIAIYAAGVCISSLFWRNITDRIGYFRVILLTQALTGVTCFAWSLKLLSSNTYCVIAIFYLTQGILISGLALATFGYIYQIAKKEYATYYFTAGASVMGVAGFVGALASGLFLDMSGGYSFSLPGLVINKFTLLFIMVGFGFIVTSYSVTRRCVAPEASIR